MSHRLEANVAREIADICKSVSEGCTPQVDMDMSLTRDLRFDSGTLMRFFSRVEQLYAGLDLERWFIEHRINGQDTLGSVVRYIADALPRAASEASCDIQPKKRPSDQSLAGQGPQSGHAFADVLSRN